MTYTESLIDRAIYRRFFKIHDLSPGQIGAYTKDPDVPVVYPNEEREIVAVHKGNRMCPSDFMLTCRTNQNDAIPINIIEQENRMFIDMIKFSIDSGVYKEMNWSYGDDYSNLGVRGIRAASIMNVGPKKEYLFAVQGCVALVRFHESFLNEQKMRELIFESLI